MAIIETEFRLFKQEVREQFAEMRKLIVGKNLVGNWVMQPMACAMINVTARQLRNIRIHTLQSGEVTGQIRWRKGKGRTVQYYKPDLEKYLDQITVS
jgi:hypothetical protein